MSSEEMTSLNEHLGYLKSLVKPAIGLLETDATSFNKLGGLPNMPEDLEWPEWDGKPLSFLCQIDLSTVPAAYIDRQFPRTGYLFFFYILSEDEMPMGYSPEDGGSWRVLYTTADARGCSERNRPKGLKKRDVYAEKPVELALVDTYPPWQDDRIEALDFTDKQSEDYSELLSSVFQGGRQHLLFGYPDAVQTNDMDLSCQLVSNGIDCMDSSCADTAEAQALAPGKVDWLLLFQLDSDEDTEMCWEDEGMLYFWIKRDDLAAGRFENCWMILQCG
jgi:uncharacterized protein YwqG